MTELLDQALNTIRSLPPETQDELACILLQLVGIEQPSVDLTPEEEEAVLRSREAATRGEFATDDEVRAIWAKYGLTRSEGCTSAEHAKAAPDPHLREVRLMIPDPQSPEVRRRVAEEVARLSRADEEDAMNWIESVSEFDEAPDANPSGNGKDKPNA